MRYNNRVLGQKWSEAGSFESFCNLPEGNATTARDGAVTFFTDLTLPAIRKVQP
jgi:acid phosphatase